MATERDRTLAQRLSVDRVDRYRSRCGGGLGAALALYEWNAQVSAAFWLLLGHTEVLVRNAMHEQLTSWAGRRRPWHLELTVLLSAEARAQIAKARQRLSRDHKRETPGRVVAELPFGFWRFLLSSRYDRSLWRPCLHGAFPHSHVPRRVVHDTLHRPRNLRNRIAHHEPIHDRDLEASYEDILTLVGWICPVARDWLATVDQTKAVPERRPSAVAGSS